VITEPADDAETKTGLTVSIGVTAADVADVADVLSMFIAQQKMQAVPFVNPGTTQEPPQQRLYRLRR
jgi:hypothetical protein